MKRIVLGLIVTAATASALAQDAVPTVRVSADPGVLVQVNNGAQAIDPGAALVAGDTITVSQGNATVTYADGCAISVTGTYQVAAASPCKPGAGSPRAQPGDRMVNGTMVAAGALGVVAVGAAVSGGDDDDKDDLPSSP